MLLYVAMREWVREAKTKSAREEDEYGIGFLVEVVEDEHADHNTVFNTQKTDQ